MEVAVAARDIPVGTLLGPEDVAMREMPPEMVPADGLTAAKEAQGRLTTVDIARGEILLRRRLLSPDYVGPRAAGVISPSKVLVAFPALELLSTLGIIKPGDHLDLMLTFDTGKLGPDIEPRINTLTLLQNLEVAAVVYGEGGGPEPGGEGGGRGAARAVLFAVDEQDALVIKYFHDIGAATDFALRSPASQGEFDLVPVDGDYLLERFNIRWRAKAK